MTEQIPIVVTHPSSFARIRCDTVARNNSKVWKRALDSDEFRAHGDLAVEVQKSIINYNNKMWTIRTAIPYAASVAFAGMAASLIIFAPASRELPATVAAAALLVLAAGIAGFTRIRAGAPGIKIDAEQR